MGGKVLFALDAMKFCRVSCAVPFKKVFGHEPFTALRTGDFLAGTDVTPPFLGVLSSDSTVMTGQQFCSFLLLIFVSRWQVVVRTLTIENES